MIIKIKLMRKITLNFLFLTLALFAVQHSAFPHSSHINYQEARIIKDLRIIKDSSLQNEVFIPLLHDDWFNQMITTLIFLKNTENELNIELNKTENSSIKTYSNEEMLIPESISTKSNPSSLINNSRNTSTSANKMSKL